MKKIVFALAVVILATSCSMQKRHYMNGFYVENKKSVDKNPNQSTIAKQELKQKTRTAISKQLAIVKNNAPTVLYTENEVVASSVSNQVVLAQNKTVSKTTTRTLSEAKKELESKNILSTSNENAGVLSKKKNVPVAAEKHGTDRGHKIGWLVFFAIILPPLGVYLKNEPVDMWFWITLGLILATCVFFPFVFILGNLFGLAAVVIALLYVLEVI